VIIVYSHLDLKKIILLPHWSISELLKVLLSGTIETGDLVKQVLCLPMEDLTRQSQIVLMDQSSVDCIIKKLPILVLIRKLLFGMVEKLGHLLHLLEFTVGAA
jgi:hypothetical protein